MSFGTAVANKLRLKCYSKQMKLKEMEIHSKIINLFKKLLFKTMKTLLRLINVMLIIQLSISAAALIGSVNCKTT